MSAFLMRLAERALGTAPAVQPKLPRRFAPLPVTTDADLEWWSEAVRRAVGSKPEPSPYAGRRARPERGR